MSPVVWSRKRRVREAKSFAPSQRLKLGLTDLNPGVILSPRDLLSLSGKVLLSPRSSHLLRKSWGLGGKSPAAVPGSLLLLLAPLFGIRMTRTQDTNTWLRQHCSIGFFFPLLFLVSPNLFILLLTVCTFSPSICMFLNSFLCHLHSATDPIQ